MTNVEKLYGLILVGGYSRRMGQDKALMNYHGKPQIEYVCDLLEKHCSKVFLSKRANQNLETRPVSPAGPAQGGAGGHCIVSTINDALEFSNIGPLGGILSAMKAYPGVSWLVMACDLPFVTEETLTTLLKNRNKTKMATAFRSIHDNLPEPLCTIWEAGSYTQILEFLKKDIHCPRKVLTNSDTHLLQQSNPQWLDNVNTLIVHFPIALFITAIVSLSLLRRG